MPDLKKKSYDHTLLVTLFLIMIIGLVILYSTSAYNGEVKFHDSFYYLKKQLFATGLGVVAMFVMAGTDYHFWKRFRRIWVQSFCRLQSYCSVMNITVPKDGCLWDRFHFNRPNMPRWQLFCSWHIL